MLEGEKSGESVKEEQAEHGAVATLRAQTRCTTSMRAELIE